MEKCSDAVRIGLIGCGEHVRTNLLPCLAGLPGARVAALCDVEEHLLRTMSALQPAAPTFASYEEMMDGVQLDALVAAGPPQLHAAVARAGIERGLHVFVEKPPAARTADLEALGASFAATPLVNMVGHNLRYSAATAELAAWCASRDLLGLDVRYVASGPRADRWGLGNAARSFLLTHAIHAIDLVLSFMGEPLSVEAGAAGRADGGFMLSVQLRFPGNRLSTVMIGSVGTSFSLDAWAIATDGATAHMNGTTRVRFCEPCADNRISREWRAKVLSVGHELAGYAGELSAFVAAVEQGGRARPSFDDALLVYRVIDRIEQQIANR